MAAMISCVERMVGQSREPHHVIADSAFAASQSIEEFKVLNNTVATISINNSTTSGFAQFNTFMSKNLAEGEVGCMVYNSN